MTSGLPDTYFYLTRQRACACVRMYAIGETTLSGKLSYMQGRDLETFDNPIRQFIYRTLIYYKTHFYVIKERKKRRKLVTLNRRVPDTRVQSR
jgi:5-methylthioribose kinase